MRNVAIAGLVAVSLAGGIAFAQTSLPQSSQMHMTSADWNALTDARINVVKAALQMNPEQMKMWPAVEDAIRARASSRQKRVEQVLSRMESQQQVTPVDLIRDRANALAQKADGLKKLADAWQPLYATLTPDQKRRLLFLTVHVLREARAAVESRAMDDEFEDED